MYVWRRWTKVDRRIEPVPIVGTTKRLPFDYDEERKDGFHPMYTIQRPEPVPSYPYEPRTLDPEILRRRLEDEAHEGTP